MTIKNYSLSENEVTSILKDTVNGYFLWITFAQDTNGNCTLKKVSANNPLQTYFVIDIAVSQIIKTYISGSYIYIAVEDDTLIGVMKNIANPVGTSYNIEKPVAVVEMPVQFIHQPCAKIKTRD